MQFQGAARLLDQGATYQRLADHGRAASATIMSVRRTGAQIDGDPELELGLSMAFDGTLVTRLHRQVISRLAANELVVGAVLPVRFDPEDPTVLAVA
ncbi:MAG: hypothetical protein QOF76_2806 [Solirubrobacteraceae bacterium]|nr:hypothetical protein [Solirubrobacteraceae bacterium]